MPVGAEKRAAGAEENSGVFFGADNVPEPSGFLPDEAVELLEHGSAADNGPGARSPAVVLQVGPDTVVRENNGVFIACPQGFGDVSKSVAASFEDVLDRLQQDWQYFFPR